MKVETIDIPSECHACASREIVFERHHKNSGYIWKCNVCNAQVGACNTTHRPFGYMADQKTRTLRHQAHFALKAIWEDRFQSKDKTMRWLANSLDVDSVNIAKLSDKQLLTVIELSNERYRTLSNIAERRSTKRRDKLFDIRVREKKKIIQRKFKR